MQISGEFSVSPYKNIVQGRLYKSFRDFEKSVLKIPRSSSLSNLKFGVLVKNTSAPNSFVRFLSMGLSDVVKIITGISFSRSSFFILSRHSKPFIRGILRSRKISDGFGTIVLR